MSAAATTKSRDLGGGRLPRGKFRPALLAVCGINLMNIMLVSVLQWARETGIRTRHGTWDRGPGIDARIDREADRV